MTCVRPGCARPRDRGVHCRKCHQRFAVKWHNTKRAEHYTLDDGTPATDAVRCPSYDAADADGVVDQMLAAWPA